MSRVYRVCFAITHFHAISGTGAVITRYYGEVYEERGTTGVIHLFASTTRIASVRTDGTIQYYHGNHLGSASVITDSTGTVKETIEYLPFGSYRDRQDLDGSFPNVNYTFTDQEDDDETGFYNYKARLYDPLLGRFISADSIVPEPGNLQAFNRYSYCVNNPLVYTDPSGHWFGLDDLVAAVVGAVVGGVSAAISGENILEGAAIGAAAGWVGWNTGFMASQQLTSVIEGSLGYCSAGTIAAGEFGGAVLGGAAGGMVAGGMGAGFNGGNIGQGMLTGMYYGAATGAVMGGITSLYGYAKGLPMDYGVGAPNQTIHPQSEMNICLVSSLEAQQNPVGATVTVNSWHLTYQKIFGIGGWTSGKVTMTQCVYTAGYETISYDARGNAVYGWGDFFNDLLHGGGSRWRPYQPEIQAYFYQKSLFCPYFPADRGLTYMPNKGPIFGLFPNEWPTKNAPSSVGWPF